MKLLLQTPAGALLDCLKQQFFQHAFCVTGEVRRWATQPVDPGGRLPMLRLTKGRASFEVETWDVDRPIRLVTQQDTLANRCLIPLSGLSAFLGADRQDLEPCGDGAVMVAGCWLSLNNTEVGSVQILFPKGGELTDGPIIIPAPHWNNWLDPSLDVRQLQLSTANQWRAIEPA